MLPRRTTPNRRCHRRNDNVDDDYAAVAASLRSAAAAIASSLSWSRIVTTMRNERRLSHRTIAEGDNVVVDALALPSTSQPHPYVPRYSSNHRGIIASTATESSATSTETMEASTAVETAIATKDDDLPSSPAFPYYESLLERIFTFQVWPAKVSRYIAHELENVVTAATMNQIFYLRDKLPTTGFFYSGTQDVVICYRCGLALRNWFSLADHGDRSPRRRIDPVLEHSYWNKLCRRNEYDDDTTDVSDNEDDEATTVTTTGTIAHRRIDRGYEARTIRAVPTAVSMDPTTPAVTVLRIGGDRTISQLFYPTQSQITRFNDTTELLRRQYRLSSTFDKITANLRTKVEHTIANVRASWELARSIIEGMTYVNDRTDLIELSNRLDETFETSERAIVVHRRRRVSGPLFGYTDDANGDERNDDDDTTTREIDDDGLTPRLKRYYEKITTRTAAGSKRDDNDAGTIGDDGDGCGSGGVSLECAVCYENIHNCVTLPCRHLVTCAKCAVKLTVCPICREIIWLTIPVRL